MNRPSPTDCPEAEQLAEYAEGVLDAATKRAVEAHLVTCADCRFVLVETVALLGEEAAVATPEVATSEVRGQVANGSGESSSSTSTDAPARVLPFRTRSWVTGVGAALAAAAALVLIVRIVSPAWLPSLLGGGPPLDELVAVLDTQRVRPIEGRLTGGFAYKPAPSPTRGGTERLGRAWTPEVGIATANIEKFAESNTSARARAALGVALIVDGELDAAIEALERAAKDLPGDPAVQSDLSAAYLARARWFNHAEDWPKALDAANRAIDLDANAPEPYFNRALAYEGLNQTGRASQAWQDYVSRDRHSRWTKEAEERRKALGTTSPDATKPQ
jgi:hypothetical protein